MKKLFSLEARKQITSQKPTLETKNGINGYKDTNTDR